MVLGGVFGSRIRIKPGSLLSFFTGYNRPVAIPGVFEYAGLDGFVFGGRGLLYCDVVIKQVHRCHVAP